MNSPEQNQRSCVKSSLHFLFISSFLGPSIGGLETLMGRMSNWLINEGHKVTLLVNMVPSECLVFFPKSIRIVELGEQLSQLCFYYKARKTWADLHIENPDVIKAFDLTATWIASILSSWLKPAPKVIFGNYFPYIIPKSKNPMKSITNRLFLYNIRTSFADSAILCMSNEQVSEFRRHYGLHRNPKFWPLPVEDPSKHVPARTPKWGCIVSVGRLEPMKEYNIYMIDIVAKLRKKGLPVTWIVYGEGGLSESMVAHINALELHEAIVLKGSLAYPRFAEAMRHAYIFVGMGTSIIEAAFCGVPSVVALAYDTSGVTYGPLYRFPFGNFGEIIDGTSPGTTVQAEIERILNLREQEYEEEIDRTRKYAQAYTMDHSMESFLDIVAHAPPPRASYGLFHWYYLHSLIEWIKQRVTFGMRTP